MFICARTNLLKLPFLIKFRFVFSSGFLLLNSSHVSVLLTLLFSVKVLHEIAVPLLFRCSLDPFKCFSVITFWRLISSKFLSMHKVFRCLFTFTTFFRYLSFLTVILEIATLLLCHDSVILYSLVADEFWLLDDDILFITSL